MSDPVIYTMAIIKDGVVLARTNVRTYLEGAAAAVTPTGQERRELEIAWGIRGVELCRDILHHEGRLPPPAA